MTYLAIGLVVAWCCGLLFLVGRAINFMRLVYNNLVPGKNDWGFGSYFRAYLFNRRFLSLTSGVDPASLTEVGRQYREKAAWNDLIISAWALAGFVLIVWASSYFMAQ